MLTSAEDHFDRGALEAERASDLVLKVTLIGEMDRLGIVGEENEGGRPDVCLGGVVELDPLARLGSGRVGVDRFFDELVQLARRNALGALRCDLEGKRQHLVYTLPELGRDERELHIRHEV